MNTLGKIIDAIHTALPYFMTLWGIVLTFIYDGSPTYPFLWIVGGILIVEIRDVKRAGQRRTINVIVSAPDRFDGSVR